MMPRRGVKGAGGRQQAAVAKKLAAAHRNKYLYGRRL